MSFRADLGSVHFLVSFTLHIVQRDTSKGLRGVRKQMPVGSMCGHSVRDSNSDALLVHSMNQLKTQGGKLSVCRKRTTGLARSFFIKGLLYMWFFKTKQNRETLSMKRKLPGCEVWPACFAEDEPLFLESRPKLLQISLLGPSKAIPSKTVLQQFWYMVQASSTCVICGSVTIAKIHRPLSYCSGPLKQSHRITMIYKCKSHGVSRSTLVGTSDKKLVYLPLRFFS